MKKLCKRDIHSSFVARYEHYETVVVAFLNIFIRVLRGKKDSFLNFVVGGGWKWFTNESLGLKAKQKIWLRVVCKDTNSALQKELLIS